MPQFKDLRLALRNLIKAPGFTLVAVLTLALGIGANTAMFNLLNVLILKPLPYSNSAQLDNIVRSTAQDAEGGVAAADFLDLQRELRGYQAVAAYATRDASISEPGQPAEMSRALRTTANLFSTLGIQPQLGRDFRASDDVHGNDRVLIISQRYWKNRFGGRANIIGHVIRVDGEPHEIIGVMPLAFNDWRHLGWVDIFRPLALDQEAAADRKATILEVIGRRSGDGSRAEADGFIAAFGSRLATAFPEINAGTTWRAMSLDRAVVSNNGPTTVSMLIGLSGFVLLIACSNLANLLLARTMARAREFAVRSALGASRVQLLRPLIAESLLLATAGGLFAILVARWVGAYLSIRTTGDNGERIIFALDWYVMGWALGAALLTVVAFGLAPALFALRLDLNGTLKSGARGSTGDRGHRRFRQALIVGQFALAMVLLAGASLFVRGLDNLNQRRAGWESEHLVSGTVLLPAASYPDAERIATFHHLTLERLQALPGVSSASISSFTPFFNWPDTRKYVIDGVERPQKGLEPAAVVNCVSPRYFDTVGTRLVAGRVFTDQDKLTSPKVFIINQSMARGLFGTTDAVGRRLAQAGTEPPLWGDVVGVVADVKSAVSRADVVNYQLYQPMTQEPRARGEISVRTTGVAPATLVAPIHEVMTSLDPDLPVRRLQPADATVYRANYQLAVLRDMLSSLAALGLALAALGIYGVIARTMHQRRGEFALRLALGAGVGDITRMVLTSGVKLAAVGTVLGLAGAAGVSRLLGASFPGMEFNGPAAMAGATAFLIAVALIACYLPARKASRISAVDALRLE